MVRNTIIYSKHSKREQILDVIIIEIWAMQDHDRFIIA